MTKIEEVARAIEQVPVMDGTYEMTGPDAVALARAAIEAMRTPTEAMIKEGEGARASAAAYQYSGVVEAYDAMIDAALNPPQESDR